MDKYQQKIDFSFKTNQQIIKLVSTIDAYKGRWNLVEQKENIPLKELRNIATIQSIGASTRIEGSQLSDEEIKNLLNNLKISKLSTRDEQEAVGYYDVLELIYENFDAINLSQNFIKQLHQKLLKYSTKDERHRGNYKNVSNEVIAEYPDGIKKIIFKPTEPHLVEIELSDLIDWTNKQLEAEEIHPLILIGLFVYEFLSIHPFQDGNGRLSRLLTSLLLLQHHYQFIKYISFENYIEQKKKSYYEALMEGQKNRLTNSEVIESWILFFLHSIENLTQKLDQKYNSFKSKGGYLNERQKLIVDYITSNQPVKLADLVNALEDTSVNTLKKDLQYLKIEKIIEAIGKNKGTVYSIKTK